MSHAPEPTSAKPTPQISNATAVKANGLLMLVVGVVLLAVGIFLVKGTFRWALVGAGGMTVGQGIAALAFGVRALRNPRGLEGSGPIDPDAPAPARVRFSRLYYLGGLIGLIVSMGALILTR